MKKKILVVDDSALMRKVICDIINSDSNFEATDYCRDGLEAYERLKTTSYDGVVLDVNMPRMDGLQLLEQLKKDGIKTTVVMVSTLTSKDAEVTIMAMERGAVDFVTKPTNIIEAKGEDFKQQVLSVLSAVHMSKAERTVAEITKKNVTPVVRKRATGNKKIVALACSTGGPKSLQEVIPLLPADLNAPIVLVQHMPTGFTRSMATRLDELSKVHVKEAEDKEVLQNGWVYIAPGGKHLEVERAATGEHRIRLNDMPPIGRLKPCANLMYDSLVDSGYDEIVCVVLTGMGADGTNGILSLSKKKPVHVIAQNEETCVVYGMPRAIAMTGIVDEVVPLDAVARTITKNIGGN